LTTPQNSPRVSWGEDTIHEFDLEDGRRLRKKVPPRSQTEARLLKAEKAQKAREKAAPEKATGVCRILFIGILLVGGLAAALLFSGAVDIEGSDRASDDDGSGDGSDDGSAGQQSERLDSGEAFVDSSRGFGVSQDGLGGAAPGQRWRGVGADAYGAQVATLRELVGQMADSDRRIGAVLATEAGQVKQARETHANVLGGFQAAIPMAEFLYFAGPSGPAMSLAFQVAVVSSGIGMCSESLHATHLESQRNAASLQMVSDRHEQIRSSLAATFF